MSEADYARITYGITLNSRNPISTQSPDDFHLRLRSGNRQLGVGEGDVGPGERENRERPPVSSFQRGLHVSSGMIQPLHGIKSKTPIYRVIYSILGPILSLLRRIFPRHITTTEELGRAMLAVAKHGAPKKILESADIISAAQV